MKNIDIKIYVLAFLSFFLWGIAYYQVLWVHKYFIILFILIVSTIWCLNTSSILFYKTLDTKDEYKKYIFSFLHITVLIALFLILLSKY